MDMGVIYIKRKVTTNIYVRKNVDGKFVSRKRIYKILLLLSMKYCRE